MNIKVLPLDFWMTHANLLEDCLADGRYCPVEVRFKRPGIYLEGDSCWFELDAERAYTYDKSYFTYTIELYEAMRLTVKQAAALKQIIELKLATRKQRELHCRYREAMEGRNVYRMSRKVSLRYLNTH